MILTDALFNVHYLYDKTENQLFAVLFGLGNSLLCILLCQLENACNKKMLYNVIYKVVTLTLLRHRTAAKAPSKNNTEKQGIYSFADKHIIPAIYLIYSDYNFHEVKHEVINLPRIVCIVMRT